MRIAIWVTAVVLLVGYTAHAFITLDRRDDRTQITSIIQDAAAAGQARNLSGAMACISTNYKDESGMNYDRLRALMAQAVKNEADFTVDTLIKSLKISGDTATMDLRLVVKKKDGEMLYQHNLILTLTKESTRHAMIIPTKIWRVTKANNIGFSPSDIF